MQSIVKDTQKYVKNTEQYRTYYLLQYQNAIYIVLLRRGIYQVLH